MQKTNTDIQGTETVEIKRVGAVVVKSFGDLNDAMINTGIDKFSMLVRQGIDAWQNAGKILIEMARDHPDIFDRITKRHPAISRSTLETFARIGRNEIWPPLLADSSLGARRLLQCNYEDQKVYCSKPIAVAIEWKNQTIKLVEKRVSDLSRSDCSIVFRDDGKINTPEQQAFRLNRNKCGPAVDYPKATSPDEKPKEFAAPRMVNVDIGYFSIAIAPDGTVKCEPCGRSPIAQPVRVIPNGTGHRSAIVIYYKQEFK